MSDDRLVNDQLLLPLPLAELLHVTIGPLADVLEEEGHAWAPLLRRVLETYLTGRADQLVKRYGVGVLEDAVVVTGEVVQAMYELVRELAMEQVDFDLWAEECG